MRFTDDDLRAFRDIWKREFNEELTDAEASHCASQLLEFYARLAQPLPSEKNSPGPAESHSPS